MNYGASVTYFSRECCGMFLGGDTEQGNEVSMAESFAFSRPSHSSFVDHVRRFDSLQRSPGTLKGVVSFGEPEMFFHRSVVPLHDVVGVRAIGEGECTFWSTLTTLGRDSAAPASVTFCGQQEVDGLASESTAR
jgi:hypothetical protein